jgi:hypothetical protein
MHGDELLLLPIGLHDSLVSLENAVVGLENDALSLGHDFTHSVQVNLDARVCRRWFDDFS